MSDVTKHKIICHACFPLQVAIAHAFAKRGRIDEALDMLKSTFDTALKTLGPKDGYVVDALIAYYDLLKDQKMKTQVKKLVQRAACRCGYQLLHT